MSNPCFISFGGGVQSTTILLLLKNSPEILYKAVGNLPSKAIFADTQVEPDAVYSHIESVKAWSPIDIEIVTKGNLLEDQRNKRYSLLPFYAKDKVSGKVSLLSRTCTFNYKIKPVNKAIRASLGLTRKRIPENSIDLWLGISTDEAGRMKRNPSKEYNNVFPLIEIGFSRQDCLDYCHSYGIYPPKSACYFCPFQDWSNYKGTVEDFNKSKEIEREFKDKLSWKYPHLELYLNRSGSGIGEGDFFDDECSGHCGL
jgi:3'-phosphoadenosine 5'-phosphosulfate sulfotransferase (PAPS reductase)/FAD synthetase